MKDVFKGIVHPILILILFFCLDQHGVNLFLFFRLWCILMVPLFFPSFHWGCHHLGSRTIQDCVSFVWAVPRITSWPFFFKMANFVRWRLFSRWTTGRLYCTRVSSSKDVNVYFSTTTRSKVTRKPPCVIVLTERDPDPSPQKEKEEIAACTVQKCCPSVLLSVLLALKISIRFTYIKWGSTQYYTTATSSVAGIFFAWQSTGHLFFGVFIWILIFYWMLVNSTFLYFLSFLSAYNYFCLQTI